MQDTIACYYYAIPVGTNIYHHYHTSILIIGFDDERGKYLSNVKSTSLLSLRQILSMCVPVVFLQGTLILARERCAQNTGWRLAEVW